MRHALTKSVQLCDKWLYNVPKQKKVLIILVITEDARIGQGPKKLYALHFVFPCVLVQQNKM